MGWSVFGFWRSSVDAEWTALRERLHVERAVDPLTDPYERALALLNSFLTPEQRQTFAEHEYIDAIGSDGSVLRFTVGGSYRELLTRSQYSSEVAKRELLDEVHNHGRDAQDEHGSYCMASMAWDYEGHLALPWPNALLAKIMAFQVDADAYRRGYPL